MYTVICTNIKVSTKRFSNPRKLSHPHSLKNMNLKSVTELTLRLSKDHVLITALPLLPLLPLVIVSMLYLSYLRYHYFILSNYSLSVCIIKLCNQ